MDSLYGISQLLMWVSKCFHEEHIYHESKIANRRSDENKATSVKIFKRIIICKKQLKISRFKRYNFLTEIPEINS